MYPGVSNGMVRRWTRSTGGYVWDAEVQVMSVQNNAFEVPDRPGQKWLVQRQLGSEVDWYTPKSDHPGLYREFADLHESLPRETERTALGGVEQIGVSDFENSTAAFANRYGFLKHGAGGAHDAATHRGAAESIFLWEHEVLSVSHLVAFWKLVKAYDEHPDRLNRRVSVRQSSASWFQLDRSPDEDPSRKRTRRVRPDFDQITFVYSLTSLPSGVDDDFRPEQDPVFPSAAIKHEAEAALREEVNRRLHRHPVTTQLVRYGSSGKDSFEIFPTTLIGAIYAQLAEEISGGPQVRSCEHCGKWYTPTRSDAKYCSPACRTGSYRVNKKNREAQDSG